MKVESILLMLPGSADGNIPGHILFRYCYCYCYCYCFDIVRRIKSILQMLPGSPYSAGGNQTAQSPWSHLVSLLLLLLFWYCEED